MDDKTVFQNQNTPTSNPWVPSDATNVPSQPAPVVEDSPLTPPASSIPQENPFTPSVAPTEVYKPVSDSPLPPPPGPSLFSLGNIAKILMGILVIVFLFFLIFKIIPGIFNKNSSNVTITYWGLWEDAPTMNSIISDFERANPNIKVNYSKQDIKQYRETLSTRFQNGNGPDVFQVHNSWLPVFKSSLLPIPSDVISKDDFSKSFYPVAQKDLVNIGAIYAIPASMDTLAMYVNTSLFDSAGISSPTNWQDFITASRQLTVKDESGKIQTAGAALGTYDNITHAPDIISMLFAQNGVDLSNLGKTPTQTNDALTFYTSFAKGEGNVWDSTLDPSILAFEKGNLAIYFGYSWDYFSIRAANPNLNFSITNVPSLPGQNQTVVSYWANGVSVKSTHQKESLLFLKYLSQKETEQKLYTLESKSRAFGQIYPRIDLAETLKSNTIVYPFVLSAKSAVSSYFASDTYDNAINSQMNTYLGNAIRSILNDGSVETASDTLLKGQSQVLGQYGK